ncbi:MAG TPA: TIGR03067 domain-containing protein [Burkholderiales bacterium]|nr:TIGR03067 domain-containing protein [Burkholderiales bacterium]
MHRLTSVICGLTLGLGLVTAFAQPGEEGRNELQGSWTAVKAIRDGKAAQGVVGNRLTFTGKRFRIQSKQGKRLYRGTFRADASAKPASIDFEHTEGVLEGKAWKGIYILDGDTLTVCDNAPDPDKGRPAAFAA